MCRINPKVDFAFKKLFGSAENIDILTEFVNSVLEQGAITAGEVFHPIEQLTLKNPYNLADYEKGKMSILDIKAQDSQGTCMILKCKLQNKAIMTNGLSIIGQRCMLTN